MLHAGSELGPAVLLFSGHGIAGAAFSFAGCGENNEHVGSGKTRTFSRQAADCMRIV